MDIKVLGPGCKNCKTLEERVREALKELELEADIEKVADTNRIMEYEVFMMPALIVDGKVKVSGRVPTVREITEWLAEENKQI